MPKCTIVLDPDQERRGFTVTVPALPGCITEGETVEECVANAQEAIALYLDDLTARGEAVPEEREHPRPSSSTFPRADRRAHPGPAAPSRTLRGSTCRRTET